MKQQTTRDDSPITRKVDVNTEEKGEPLKDYELPMKEGDFNASNFDGIMT